MTANFGFKVHADEPKNFGQPSHGRPKKEPAQESNSRAGVLILSFLSAGSLYCNTWYLNRTDIGTASSAGTGLLCRNL